MNKKLLKYLSFCLLTILMFSNVATSFAGTSDSIGAPGSSGGSGSGGKSEWGIGTSRNSKGLTWKYFSGSEKLTCIIPFHERELSITNATKAAYLATYSNKSSVYTWLNWEYWDKYITGNPSKYDAWYPGTGVYTDGSNGKLQDPELVKEATNNSYTYNSGKYYSNGLKKLDAIWIEGHQESTTDTITTIVYATADGSALMNDRSKESAESLYNSPTTSLPYSGKSGPTEMNHSKTIKATYMTITKKETYMTDGNKKWNVQTVYTKGGKTHETKTIKYDVKQATVSQKYFKPYDLNKNGVASESDIKSSYPLYSNGSPLLMSVNNKQNITDGSALKTLDTNVKLSFSVKFNNDQFGIPKLSQGGFNLLSETPGKSYKNSNGTYNASVLNEAGLKGTATTGVLYADGMAAKNISGKISNDVYWGGSVKADLSSNSASLTYGGTEKIGGNAFSFTKGWTGGDFIFKTTKMGTYKLSSSGRVWWEAQYEQGKFYCYGVEYKGTINISGISNPSVVNSSLYAKLASQLMTQPILKGTIEAKTVAGNLG